MGEASLDQTPLARNGLPTESLSRDAASDAARALQELQRQHSTSSLTTPVAKTGNKRSRPMSIENALQENVRDILGVQRPSGEAAWPDTLIRSRVYVSESNIRQSVRPSLGASRKRVCCSAEAAHGYQPAIPRSVSFAGPGMWEGILN
jgi:PHO85 cyclin-5